MYTYSYAHAALRLLILKFQLTIHIYIDRRRDKLGQAEFTQATHVFHDVSDLR